MWTTKGMNDYMTLNCCKYLMKTANPFSERYGWWVNCGLSVIAWSHCSIAWVFLAFASPTSQVSCPPNQAKSCLAHRFQNGCWKKKILIIYQQQALFFINVFYFPLFPDCPVVQYCLALYISTYPRSKIFTFIKYQNWKYSDDNSHTWIIVWLVLHALPTDE